MEIREVRKYFVIGMVFATFILGTSKIYAAGDGPRVFWAVPVDTNVITPMYFNIDSNYGFDSSLIAPMLNLVPILRHLCTQEPSLLMDILDQSLLLFQVLKWMPIWEIFLHFKVKVLVWVTLL